MRAQEFAAVASRLAQIPTAGRADFRTWISRAYYAAYLVAVDALTHIGAVPHAGREDIAKRQQSIAAPMTWWSMEAA